MANALWKLWRASENLYRSRPGLGYGQGIGAALRMDRNHFANLPA